MLYCEDCTQLHRMNRPNTFPYHNHYMTTCEMCGKHKDCYDYPAIWAKPKKDWTSEEILLDKRLREEYHQKAESLVITFVRGPQAGNLDHKNSEWLKGALVRFKGTEDIDWYATYELRVRLQQGYYKVEHRKGELYGN